MKPKTFFGVHRLGVEHDAKRLHSQLLIGYPHECHDAVTNIGAKANLNSSVVHQLTPQRHRAQVYHEMIIKKGAARWHLLLGGL